MSLAGAIATVSVARNNTARTVTLTFTGNYTAGGDTLDLTALTNPNFLAGAKQFGVLPKRWSIDNAPDGYTLEWKPGTTLANGKLKVYTASNTELSAGAYPAGLTGATDSTITFEWPSML